jgi:hypothetical protein
MDLFSCDECRAIYRELRDSYRAATEGTPDPHADPHNAPQQIADWLQELNEQACAEMRERSSLWKTWRRLQQHRNLTGHTLSVLPIPPNMLSNPN